MAYIFRTIKRTLLRTRLNGFRPWRQYPTSPARAPVITCPRYSRSVAAVNRSAIRQYRPEGTVPSTSTPNYVRRNRKLQRKADEFFDFTVKAKYERFAARRNVFNEKLSGDARFSKRNSFLIQLPFARI